MMYGLQMAVPAREEEQRSPSPSSRAQSYPVLPSGCDILLAKWPFPFDQSLAQRAPGYMLGHLLLDAGLKYEMVSIRRSG